MDAENIKHIIKALEQYKDVMETKLSKQPWYSVFAISKLSLRIKVIDEMLYYWNVQIHGYMNTWMYKLKTQKHKYSTKSYYDGESPEHFNTDDSDILLAISRLDEIHEWIITYRDTPAKYTKDDVLKYITHAKEAFSMALHTIDYLKDGRNFK